MGFLPDIKGCSSTPTQRRPSSSRHMPADPGAHRVLHNPPRSTRAEVDPAAGYGRRCTRSAGAQPQVRGALRREELASDRVTARRTGQQSGGY